jgi:hypothetical protein
MTSPDLALLRLAAQRIAGPGFDTPADAVRWLTAVQGQDHPGAVTSIALRTRSRDRADVDAALTSGQVVKSWPMRGTLHFVPAEDLPWLLELTAPRVIASVAPRHSELDLDERSFELARELAIEALHGRRELGRAELLAVWDKAGLSTAGQRGYHLILHLSQTGTLCFGPVRGGKQQLVLLAEWAPRTRYLERAEALGELATRYLRSHGPASAKDFGRWGKLVAADVRTGIALARPELESLVVDGVEYLMDPATPERLAACRARARGVFLLPGFDEFILGYGDRTAAVPAEFADRIVPGGNGMFRSTVVAGGQVVGTWLRGGTAGRAAGKSVQATPFTRFSATVEAAIPRLYADLP